MKRLLTILTALFTLAACTSIEENVSRESMDKALEGKPVCVTFSLPNVQVSSPTRSLDSEGEITGEPYLDPNKLFLVVCGHNQSIKYIRKAELIGSPQVVPVSDIPDYPINDPDGVTEVTMYTFQVLLELSDSDRTIHFLGNVDEDRLITGSSSYQVLPGLLSYEGKQAYWQKVYLENIHPKTDEHGQYVMQNGSYLPDDYTVNRLKYVPLIRNYAKIQVTDATDPADGFELHSYSVIYYPKRGSIVPYRSNTGSFNFNTAADSRLSGYERCDFPTLEETLGYQGNLPSGVAFDHSIPDASMFEDPSTSGGKVIRYDKTNPDQGFYIYERGVPTTTMDPTFIIIRGRFGGEGEYYYYRLDLMETKVVNHESVYQYYPIYRNFRYNIQLNRISSQGVSTPEAAANASGAEDISADISMRHLSDISNGQTRLVVEPYMARTLTGPNESGYYYLYARFFNDVNSAVPNVDWGAVSVELEPMEDGSDDILILYDDQGHDVHGGGFFYPVAQEVGGESGFRVIRFNTIEPLDETKTQKIKITGRNQYVYEQYPLYREVEISLQKKQALTVDCDQHELSIQLGSKQKVSVTIPAGLPDSMFPLEFIMEAEAKTLTPDNSVAGNNLPVQAGISISDNPGYAGKNTFQFIRTITLSEYKSLPVNEGFCTFDSYFKSNRSKSATTIWVKDRNDYFYKGSVSFTNAAEPDNHFYFKADDDEDCIVKINKSGLMYKIDDGEWKNYSSNTAITIERSHKVSFKSTSTITAWNGGLVKCYKPGSNETAKDGKFSIGGNLASLIVGDNYDTEGASFSQSFSFIDFLNGHINLTDASNLVMPMMTIHANCYKSFFDGCINLKAVPESLLPATNMKATCYRNMFLNCESLETAPYLPAENINADCYQRMFTGCKSLKLIKINAKNYRAGAFISDSNTSWVKNVAANGEIWMNPAIKSSSGWQNIVPTGWTIKSLPDGGDWN
ncbi:MAG: hypothetical protein J6W74_02585 [Bacteroidales bacterium]|nr:hypothetical protein [Bacteroidales bacterium]